MSDWQENMSEANRVVVVRPGIPPESDPRVEQGNMLQPDIADTGVAIVTLPHTDPAAGYVTQFPSVMPAANWDMHQDFEIGVQLRGARESYYENFHVMTEAGDVWLHPSWEPHGWRTTVRDARNLTVLFLPDFLGDEAFDGHPWFSLFALPPRERPRVNDEATRLQVLSIADELALEFIHRSPGWLPAARLGVLKLLLTLQRGRNVTRASGWSGSANRSDLSRILPAIALVRERPGERVSLAEAAAACVMGVTQFRCIFSRTMAVTFGRFAVRARLGHAARLLIQTDLTVDAVAHAAAFSDGSHLNAHFRKAYGCTANEYRWRTTDRFASG